MPAFRIGRFLYFYRLVGVVAFELTGRGLLLFFPNTFEYFFIAYEAVRTRWDPLRWGLVLGDRRRRDLGVRQAAAGVLDPRGAAGLHGHDPGRALVPSGAVVAVLALLAVLCFFVRPRLAAADWARRFAPIRCRGDRRGARAGRVPGRAPQGVRQHNAGEDLPDRPDQHHLRRGAARRRVEQPRTVPRDRGLRGDQRRGSACGRRSAATRGTPRRSRSGSSSRRTSYWWWWPTCCCREERAGCTWSDALFFIFLFSILATCTTGTARSPTTAPPLLIGREPSADG